METKFNFNSQVCTSKIQSERLLFLGLKKETADMCITDNVECAFPCPEDDRFIPAWSLHRLIILCGNIACDWIFRNDDCYTNAINCLEWLIKEGYFNKEYLEE